MTPGLRRGRAVGAAGCEEPSELPRGAGQSRMEGGTHCPAQLSKQAEREGKTFCEQQSRAQRCPELLQPIPAQLPPLWAGFCHPHRRKIPYNSTQPRFVQPILLFLAQLGGTINKTPSQVGQTAGR